MLYQLHEFELTRHGPEVWASLPLTLQKAQESGRLAAGDRVVSCGFGGGSPWGAAPAGVVTPRM